ncbi:DDE superendonuclease family protein [Francisella tularensis]|nr:DDE superendonuclease family protein [Francisella tularensis]
MDNASFHKSSKLIEIANKFDVQILYLPPYSPDLNPIERFRLTLKIFRKVNNSFENFVMLSLMCLTKYSRINYNLLISF